MTPRFLDTITLDSLEDDPYPTYARLRREAPIAWIPAAEVWFATRFDDCAAIGGDAETFAGATAHPTLQRVFGAPNVLTSGGDTHRDLRRGIDPRLQPESVNATVDGLVRPAARKHLERIAPAGSADLMSEYFEPVSVEALRRVMGLDGLVDANTLRGWFRDLNAGVANFGLDPQPFAVADAAAADIEQVLRPHLLRLGRYPDESMLSHMLWAGRDTTPRAIELLLPSIKVILLGGMQEPGHAAGSTLLGLFGEPDQWAQVRTEPREHIPLAVHEGLRWIAPIGAVERQATRDVELHGQLIRAGEIVQTVLGSANRDESRFADPDRFDLYRSGRAHQGFGNGEHFCAGHFFARQVEHIMLDELIAALPDLRPDPTRSPRVTGWVFRAPKTLPVRWTPPPDSGRQGIEVRGRTLLPAPPEHADTMLLRVREMQWATPAILTIELVEPDGNPLPSWTAGAHVDVWTRPDRAGQYSLCSDPAAPGSWRLAVLREASSHSTSTDLHTRLRTGDLLHVGLPRNHFPLVGGGPFVFLAAGVGVTPILPMARLARHAALPYTLHYAGRSAAQLAFRAEMEALGATLHLSDQKTRLDVLGLVDEAARAEATVYACGPTRLLDALRAGCEQRGVALRTEVFTGVQAHQPGDRPFDLILSRADRTLHVAADESALDALRAADIDIRTSCTQGNCGSCETRVLAGRVDHRDVLLTPGQRDRHDRMMVCVSRAETDSLTLDL